jgi:4-hydroxy-tetrahydrodipicolinate synthase
MLLTAQARGVYPIAPTPFFDDGRIDTESIDRLTDFYGRIGSTGITVLGQLGEAPKLGHDESVQIASRMIRRAPSLPVIVGVSAPASRRCGVDPRGHERGAAGVMIAPPNTCAPTTRSSATTARRSRRSAPTCRSCCRTIR